MLSIDDHIIKVIGQKDPGTLFFVEDFLSFGSAKAVAKAIERLAKKDKLQRVAWGIYAQLQTHAAWGVLQPSTQKIAEAISRRDKARLTLTGSAALNALGLSTQVPANVVYLTDGAARSIMIGNHKIVFKKTSPKNLAAIGKVSSLAIQALKTIGKEHLTAHEENIILHHLRNEEPAALQHDMQLAPEWIRVIFRKALKTT